jgi:hypothetical protein
LTTLQRIVVALQKTTMIAMNFAVLQCSAVIRWNLQQHVADKEDAGSGTFRMEAMTSLAKAYPMLVRSINEMI